MTETRRPIHLGVAVGISASLYAVSLAAVTGLQSHQNAQITDSFAPLADAIDRLDSANADLATRLDSAGAALDTSATAYSAIANQVPNLEARLKNLAGTVTKIRGTSISIPSVGSVPRVPSSGGRTIPRPKPPVSSTTSASGH